MKRYVIFYGGLLYGEWDHIKDAVLVIPPDVAPDCILYISDRLMIYNNRQWFNWDLTPILDEDVPPELKLNLLLME